jgi:hypothetical protein
MNVLQGIAALVGQTCHHLADGGQALRLQGLFLGTFALGNFSAQMLVGLSQLQALAVQLHENLHLSEQDFRNDGRKHVVHGT